MKITNEISKKISYYSLLIWCGLPLLVLVINPLIKETSTVYFFMFLIMIGIVGIINGIIYFKNNIGKIRNMKINSKLPFIVILLFLVWTFISCLFADNKLLSLIGSEYRHDGFLSYICYAAFFINGLIVSSDKLYIQKLFRLLIISSCILGINVLIGDNIFITDSNAYEPSIYAAIFSNENHFAYYLTISIMCSFFFSIYENKIYILSFLLLSEVLMMNNTFGSYLAVLITIVIMFIYYLIKKEKRIIACLLLSMFICLSLFNSNIIKNMKQTINEVVKIVQNRNSLKETRYIDYDNNLEENQQGYLLICAGNSRLDLWINGVKLSNKKPLLGYGLENLKKPYKDVVMCDATDRPHNTFIQILMTTGYVGLIMWVSYLSMLFYQFIVNKKLNKYLIMTFGMMTTYIISSFFGNTMFYTTPYFILLLGVASSIFLKNKKSIN